MMTSGLICRRGFERHGICFFAQMSDVSLSFTHLLALNVCAFCCMSMFHCQFDKSVSQVSSGMRINGKKRRREEERIIYFYVCCRKGRGPCHYLI